MKIKKISDTVYQIPLGAVNVFVIAEENGFLTLVDTGNAGSETKIFKAIAEIGKKPSDIHKIFLTHSHPDHAGSLAAIKKETNAKVWMHSEDASLVRQGIAIRLPQILSSGFVNWLIFNLFIKRVKNEIPVAEVENEVKDGDILPFNGGIEVIHTPGHSKGHICFLINKEKLLICGDVAANLPSLGMSTVYENPEEGLASIRKLFKFDFDKAVFGHGEAISIDANKRFVTKFGANSII
jgi:glyoxylase-like metal-dependent hydrolase (beta-lactamase superfamily II)